MTARVLIRLVAATAVALLSLPSVANAHAAYKESDPADESTVASAPSEIWAEFTEPPAQGSTLTVFNECGDRVDLGNSRIDGFRLYVGIDPAHKGGFRVDFRVTSAYDSHVTTGSFTFTATGGEDCAGPPAAGGNSGGNEGGSGGGSGSNGGSGGGSGSGSGSGEGSSGGNGGDEGELREVSSIGMADEGDEREGGGNTTEREGERSTDENDRGSEEASGPVVAEPPSETPGIWDGIALRDLLIGYGFALLIGAAGGKVYAGIVGPTRR